LGDFSKLSDEELLAQFEATVTSLRAERRVEGEKELLVFPSAPTAVRSSSAVTCPASRAGRAAAVRHSDLSRIATTKSVDRWKCL
jgi:hypothetical protein